MLRFICVPLSVLIPHIETHGEIPLHRQAMLEEEHSWVLSAQQDLKNFEPLYKKYHAAIYEFVYRRCDDVDDCMDITSLVFEKAMINIAKFKPQGFPFGSWLYRIASSEIGNYYRKLNKDRKIWVRTEGLMEIAQEIEKEYLDEENIHTLLKAMQHLRPEELEFIVMRYFEKRSFVEIGLITDNTEANARVKVFRLLKKLKTAFKVEDRP